MEEILVNLHNHTNVSDGSGSYHEIAQAGLSENLDVIVITDHNIYIQEKDAYFYRDGRRLLMLIGEEIHDPQGEPGNHLLAMNHANEYANLSNRMQSVIDAVNRDQGITVLAHPFEKRIPILKLNAYSWHKWSVQGFTGMEIFNLMSEFKNSSSNPFNLFWNLLFPNEFPTGANAEALQKWDELLTQGLRISGFAGSDAHQLKIRVGPIRFQLFPYNFHFKALNTHVYLPQPLTGNLQQDRAAVFSALRNGTFFIGLDLIHPTRGFEFKADHEHGTGYPGSMIRMGNSVTIKINVPASVITRLIHNGKVIQQWNGNQSIPYTVINPGYYRVECYFPYKGKLRGWIYSNPIYLYRGKW